MPAGEQTPGHRKTDWSNRKTVRVFLKENCVLLRGLDVSGLEVHGQKIPTPAKENSTASNWVPMTQKDTQV